MVVLNSLATSYLKEQYLLDDPLGQKLASEYKNKEITKKYFDIALDDLIYDLPAYKVKELLLKHRTHKLNLKACLNKITDESPASFIIEPALVTRTEDEVVEFNVVASVPVGYTLLKYYPLSWEQLQEFYFSCYHQGYRVIGVNWIKDVKDSPSILIYGKPESVDSYKKALGDIYGWL